MSFSGIVLFSVVLLHGKNEIKICFYAKTYGAKIVLLYRIFQEDLRKLEFMDKGRYPPK